MRVSYVLISCGLATSCGACRPADNSAKQTLGTAAASSTRSEKPVVLGIRFDPERLRPGMRIGKLIVDTVVTREVTIDSAGATAMIPTRVWVGTVRLHGALTLRGRLVKHPDSEVHMPCFETDSASATLMPRWAGDVRRPWFCFPDVGAERLLGNRMDGSSLEIVIDQLAIRRSFSDDVNTARLARVRDLARCYRSPHSVLIGPTTRTGQQGRPPGWVRLEGFPETDGGEAELRDNDGKAMRAGWRRQAGDSVTLRAFNDFVRIEIRFLVSNRELSGHATAHSDAALEPDSSGRLSDLRRSWKFDATEVTCDSMY